jgi:hypothetical protein
LDGLVEWRKAAIASWSRAFVIKAEYVDSQVFRLIRTFAIYIFRDKFAGARSSTRKVVKEKREGKAARKVVKERRYERSLKSAGR